MTHYKTSRKKISSTAVANGVLWAEGVGNLPVVAKATSGDLVEIELKDVQLCPMATANLISMSQAADQGCMLHVTSPENVAFVLSDDDETELAVELVGGLYIIEMRLQIPPTDSLAFRAGSPPVRSSTTGGASPSLQAMAQCVHRRWATSAGHPSSS